MSIQLFRPNDCVDNVSNGVESHCKHKLSCVAISAWHRTVMMNNDSSNVMWQSVSECAVTTLISLETLVNILVCFNFAQIFNQFKFVLCQVYAYKKYIIFIKGQIFPW